MLNPIIKITPEILNLIAKTDEFKGEWKAIGNLSPERLDALKHVATVGNTKRCPIMWRRSVIMARALVFSSKHHHPLLITSIKGS